MSTTFANPTITYIQILTTSGKYVDTNNLKTGKTYLIKVGYGNDHPTGSIEPASARMLIGFGMGLIITPGFDLVTAGSKKLSFAHRKEEGQQDQVNCTIAKALPPNFSGVIKIKVVATEPQSSTASVNFLVQTVQDIDSGDNGATVGYTVI